MIKLILLFVFATACCQGFSQQTNSSVNKENYLLKSKHQKTAAWILLVTGTGLGIAGASIVAKEDGQKLANAFTTVFTLGAVNPPEPKHSVAGPILEDIGLGAIAGGVYLFFAAHKNIRKASLSFSNDRISQITNGNLVFKNMPSVKLKIQLP